MKPLRKIVYMLFENESQMEVFSHLNFTLIALDSHKMR